MIIEKYLQNGKFVEHKSDAEVMIRQIETGVLYKSAIDLVPCIYTYEETDTPFPAKPLSIKERRKAEVIDNGTEENN